MGHLGGPSGLAMPPPNDPEIVVLRPSPPMGVEGCWPGAFGPVARRPGPPMELKAAGLEPPAPYPGMNIYIYIERERETERERERERERKRERERE